MTAIDDVLAAAENPAYHRVAVARILLRQDLIARHEQLEADLAAAVDGDRRENRDPQAPEIARQITALEAEIETARVEFRFRAVGKRAWADLIAKHPPTKEQKRDHPHIDHNPVTFPAAAIAASCVEPEMTEDDARRLEAALSTAQFLQLWGRCMEANLGGLDAPKSAAAGAILQVRSESGAQPTTIESPAQSSSAA